MKNFYENAPPSEICGKDTYMDRMQHFTKQVL